MGIKSRKSDQQIVQEFDINGDSTRPTIQLGYDKQLVMKAQCLSNKQLAFRRQELIQKAGLHDSSRGRLMQGLLIPGTPDCRYFAGDRGSTADAHYLVH